MADRLMHVEVSYVNGSSEDGVSSYSQIIHEEGYIAINTAYSNIYTADLSIGRFTDDMAIDLYVTHIGLNKYYTFGMTADGKIMIGKNKDAINGDTVLDSSMAITDAELEELLV